MWMTFSQISTGAILGGISTKSQLDVCVDMFSTFFSLLIQAAMARREVDLLS